MLTNIIKKEDIKAYVSIILIVLICHGLLLLNDGLYYDDIHLVDMLQSGDWKHFYSILSMFGNTLIIHYDWLFTIFDNPVFAFKFIIFLSIVLSALLVYQICITSGFMSSIESFFIAILSVVYPAHLMTFVINISFHFVCLMLFLLAAYLAMLTVRTTRKWSLFLRGTAFIFFFLSYTTNSILVFHFGFLLFYFVYTQKQLGLSITERPYSFFVRHWDVISVPFVFWFWKIVFTPVHGYGLTFQSGYNKIVLDPLGFIKGYFKLFKGIRAPFLKITLNPIVPVLSFMLVALLYFGLKLKWHQQFRDRRQFPYVLIFGILLLFAGSFPYVAVGKNFGGGFGIGWGGYGSRNQLLLGIPMAMILVSLSCLILGPRSRRRFNVIFLLTLIVTFSVFRIHLYLTWQAEAIKQHSTLYNLSQLSQAKDIHVFGILDRYPIAEENTMLWWGIAFKKVFGDFTRFGFYEGFVQGTPDLAGYYSFKGGIAHWYSLEDLSHLITGFQTNVYPKHFNPTGRQATLIIDRGPFESEVELVGKYYFYKYLRRAELNRFLSEVTRLSLIERFPPKG